MLKFYDVVTQPGAPFFSPFAERTRLCLLHKGIEFETCETTYGELRTVWKERMGVEKASVPFLQFDDGTFLMDSGKIAEWLDETYPSAPSIFLPNAALPIDTSSPEYIAAKEQRQAFGAKYFGAIYSLSYTIFAPLMASTFSKDDYDYFTSDERQGEGGWAECLAADKVQAIAEARAALESLNDLLSDNTLFFQSPSAPGWADFFLMGVHRFLASVDAKITSEVWEHGKVGKWLARMHSRYGEGLASMRSRDPK